MKRIKFINQHRQLYYCFKKYKINSKIVKVIILLKDPVNIYYDKNKECIKRNTVDNCFININDIKIVKDIMKHNKIAIQYLNYETNKSISDISQLKVSYKKEILYWNPKWKIIN